MRRSFLGFLRTTIGRTTTALVTALALTGTTTAHAADAPTVAPLPDRIIDVVQVTWTGARAPKATAQSVADVITSDTIARWKKISNGRIVFTFGRILDTVQTRVQMPCDAAGSIDYMNAVQTAAYQRAGITKWDSRYVIIVAPNPTPDCVWDGRGVVNPPAATSGQLILNNTDDRTVIAHELGHNLGFGHSNYEKCADGRADGPWEDCTAVEYGSATDLMSNNDRSSSLNAYHQWRVGWIADSDVAIGNKSMSVTLNPVDTNTGTRAIFIRDNTATYWVEYRTADPENGIDAGLVIYRSDPPPGSSVDSPIASDKSDPTNSNVTTDVWMISLGNYRYVAAPATGSPSLKSGTLFTTAFGGASLIAEQNANGSATVTISRNTTRTTPTTPRISDPATWTTPVTEVLRDGLDDSGIRIEKFEARVSSGGTTKIVDVVPAATTSWERTYLNPLLPPRNVLVKDLPEGNYDLQLRSVDALGTRSEWSPTQSVVIDLGAPRITPAFRATAASAGTQLEWIGATDAGSGVCRAQLLNADGFAVRSWSATSGGTPTFPAPQTPLNEQALVYDCKGNGVLGDISIASQQLKTNGFTRTGSWKVRSSGEAVCIGACSATLNTAGNATTSFMVRSSGAITVVQDGKPVKTLKATTRAAARTIFTTTGEHKVQLRGSNITLLPAIQVRSTWMQSGTRSLAELADDASLADSTQQQLAQLGFSQLDFIDSMTVRPLNGGTSTEQGTLDLCGTDYASEKLRADRRQVFVSTSDKRVAFLSTETVRYQSAAAVQQAVKELDDHVSKCKADGYVLTSANEKQPHEFLPLPTLPTGLVAQQDRRIYLVNIGESSTATTLLAAYQFRGDTLNALYVVLEGKNSIDADAQRRWLDVAAILAQRLTTATAKLTTA